MTHEKLMQRLKDRADMIDASLVETILMDEAAAALEALKPYADADKKGRLHILPPDNSVAQCLEFAKKVTDMGMTLEDAIEIIKAQNERREEPLTLDELATAYLDICGQEDCSGDRNVGIPPCQFYDFTDDETLGGCRLQACLRKTGGGITDV